MRFSQASYSKSTQPNLNQCTIEKVSPGSHRRKTRFRKKIKDRMYVTGIWRSSPMHHVVDKSGPKYSVGVVYRSNHPTPPIRNCCGRHKGLTGPWNSMKCDGVHMWPREWTGQSTILIFSNEAPPKLVWFLRYRCEAALSGFFAFFRAVLNGIFHSSGLPGGAQTMNMPTWIYVLAGGDSRRNVIPP